MFTQFFVNYVLYWPLAWPAVHLHNPRPYPILGVKMYTKKFTPQIVEMADAHFAKMRSSVWKGWMPWEVFTVFTNNVFILLQCRLILVQMKIVAIIPEETAVAPRRFVSLICSNLSSNMCDKHLFFIFQVFSWNILQCLLIVSLSSTIRLLGDQMWSKWWAFGSWIDNLAFLALLSWYPKCFCSIFWIAI